MPTRPRGIHRRKRSARRPKGDLQTESLCFQSSGPARPFSNPFLLPSSFAGQFGLADGKYDERVAMLEDAADSTEVKYAKALELSGGAKQLEGYKKKSSSALRRRWKLVAGIRSEA